MISFRKLALYFSSIITLTIIWYILSFFVPRYLFPTPFDVLKAFVKLWQKEDLLANIILTLYRVTIGFLLGLSLGFIIGVFSMLYKVFRDLIYPLIAFITVTPSFAFVPLLMLWIGLNDALAITAVMICVGFPIVYSFISGRKNIDPEIVNVALTLGASKKDIVFKIIIPLSVTHLASLLKFEVSHSWKLVFVTEYLALSSGLGYLMVKAYSIISVDEIIALIIILGFLALFFQYTIELIETRIMKKWGYIGETMYGKSRVA